MLNTVLTMIMLFNLSTSCFPSLPISKGNISGSSSNNSLSKITYNEGHLKLQKIMDELAQHTGNLDRGSYIGYQYSTSQLYNYLLAINYREEDLLDSNYKYQHNFSSFEELVTTYHKNVDFTSVQLTKMKHTGSIIEIVLSYKHKKTKQAASLNYILSYEVHGLTDKSDFDLSSKLSK
ncbi:hypothetical protein J31TS6_22700 [Brevibacillus reuszeri]|uniref:hypothetical protein n=1 Tax=Brevibacillus reuszeri TaxID=54915 RepID=UPI001B167A5F|nr:hypothetical protein [Brevibacillus reuszeri]GIO06242.1 hypothetical protein J31TS6_22700 [Brevibacillus reuszeri]